MRERKIFWREETGSFLPQLNRLELESYFQQELEAYKQDLEKGLVLSPGDFWERFMQPVKIDSKTISYTAKPEAEGHWTDYDRLRPVGNKLYEDYGIWVPIWIVFNTLTKMSHRKDPQFRRKNEVLSFSEDQLGVAVTNLYDALLTCHSQVDEFLKRVHKSLKIDKRAEPFELMLKETATSIVDEVAEANCDDRWFTEVDYRTTIFLESVNCIIEQEEVEEITDKYFSSWIPPGNDELIQYADEIAALGVKALFESRYDN